MKGKTKRATRRGKLGRSQNREASMETLGEDGDQFNSDFSGGECVGVLGGWHEQPNDVAFPGDVKLDDDDNEDAMNLQVRQEVDRLRREVPDLRQFHITPGLHWSGNAEQLTVDAMPWKVTFFAGDGLFFGDGPTLAAAMADGIDGYKAKGRARALDNAASVAPSAEKAVA